MPEFAQKHDDSEPVLVLQSRARDPLMEFREYATHETNAVVARLMASQADAQVRLAREAIEAAARALEGQAAPVTAADDVRDLVQRLEAAAGIAVQRVQQEAQKALEAVRDELADARRETAEAESLVAALRDEIATLADRATTAECDLDATIEAHRQIEIELGGLRRELEGARATIGRLESGLEAAAAQRATLVDDLAAARASASRFEAGLAAAEAATAEEADARATLQGELDAARSRLAALEESRATLRAELESSQSVWKAAEADLESTRAALLAMEADFSGARATLEAREIELDTARTTLRAVEGDLDAARASASAAQTELEATRAAASAAATEAGTTRQALTAVTADLEATRATARTVDASLDTTRAALSSAVADLDASRAATAAAEASLETTRAALAAAEGELAAARVGLDDAQRRTPLIEAAAAACGSLSSARTIAELFGALVGRMSSEFTRVAIFRAKAHHLEGEYGHGFDEPTDVSKLVIPLTLDSIITRAHASGLMSRLEPGEGGGSTPLGGSPSLALALPIMHQGETVAVLYADAEDPAAGAHDERPAFAQVVAAHAALLLARMSQEMKTLHELRDYAAMLLQEAQEMYAADVEAGRSDADRRRRLQDTVECARQLYAQRAALEGEAAAGLLDEQITEAIGESPSTPFARDLALCDGTPQNARRTAS